MRPSNNHKNLRISSVILISSDFDCVFNNNNDMFEKMSIVVAVSAVVVAIVSVILFPFLSPTPSLSPKSTSAQSTMASPFYSFKVLNAKNQPYDLSALAGKVHIHLHTR
jgi:hypothetical protein